MSKKTIGRRPAPRDLALFPCRIGVVVDFLPRADIEIKPNQSGPASGLFGEYQDEELLHRASPEYVLYYRV